VVVILSIPSIPSIHNTAARYPRGNRAARSLGTPIEILHERWELSRRGRDGH